MYIFTYSYLHLIKETIPFQFLSGIPIEFCQMLYLNFSFLMLYVYLLYLCQKHNIFRLSPTFLIFLEKVMSQGRKYCFKINAPFSLKEEKIPLLLWHSQRSTKIVKWIKEEKWELIMAVSYG